MELKCKYCGITPPKNHWNCQRWLDKHEKAQTQNQRTKKTTEQNKQPTKLKRKN